MMESAKEWKWFDTSDGLYGSVDWRILMKGEMGSDLVMILSIRMEDMPQVPLTEYDDVIEAFPPDRADEPFTVSVLPG